MRMSLAGAAICALLFTATAQAKKPGTVPVIGPDLAGTSISVKTKCTPTTCSVNNLTVNVRNLGDADAPNTRISFYLSADDVLTTQSDGMNVVDIPLHTQSLGTVKAGKTKKRTLGGGLLKKAGYVGGSYIFVVLDSDDTLVEADETNNTISKIILFN